MGINCSVHTSYGEITAREDKSEDGGPLGGGENTNMGPPAGGLRGETRDVSAAGQRPSRVEEGDPPNGNCYRGSHREFDFGWRLG